MFHHFPEDLKIKISISVTKVKRSVGSQKSHGKLAEPGYGP
jgi:hypothetical protein